MRGNKFQRTKNPGEIKSNFIETRLCKYKMKRNRRKRIQSSHGAYIKAARKEENRSLKM